MSEEDPSAALQARLAATGYIASPDLATCAVLAQALEKPVLLEGEAGVGKTGLAQALADAQGLELVRLQCYEGIDASTALYDWNYPRQLLAARSTDTAKTVSESAKGLFSEDFLLERPLLYAIRQAQPTVLLIDEVDRGDEEFEAFLLEVLSDFQVTVPELGTLSARARPQVILTSNGTRELSDALRRRCLYFYIDYPDADQELDIVRERVPGLAPALAREAVSVVQQLRMREMHKVPGVAETLDWCAALLGLGVGSIRDNRERVQSTLVCLLKTRADQLALGNEDLDAIVQQATSESGG